MSITTNRLFAAAGLCAAAAGAIFIGVQINHPPADVAHLVTTEMTLRETREGPDGRPGAGRLRPACSFATAAGSGASGASATGC